MKATCALRHFANGTAAPNGCKLASFTTVDLSARYNLTKNLQLFGSITNLFDKIAPLDPLTYGGMSYNPMDASARSALLQGWRYVTISTQK